ncbi:hypothetical protein ACFFUB_11250 [Algimonas porphyrae]|uniref:Uncharacterized protein n=1 Tax=Algimonas porphyrae TaxID=1128113 RepID=A0ABQ5V610_9PROT|nr:hypothetical protein [Algimonas porphyrae]GLQ22011.1 hypothetical protein GCM10007854_29660 [Algimonas porphyrae]
MMTEQSAKADARRSAQTAPQPDPEAAQRALHDAAAHPRRMPAQRVSQTQTSEIAGRNVHRAIDQVISEFDDPDAHKVE